MLKRTILTVISLAFFSSTTAFALNEKLIKSGDSIKSSELIFTGSTLWSSPIEVKQFGGYIYVLYYTGLQILKESNDILYEKGRVTLEPTVPIGPLDYHPLEAAIEIAGNNLIVLIGSNLFMIDISDPQHPHVTSKLDIDTSNLEGDMVLAKGYIYISYKNGFHIIKINSSSLEFIKSVITQELWRGSCAVEGNLLYVGGRGLYIYDITIPDSPVQLEFSTDPWAKLLVNFNNFRIKNGYMYLYETYPLNDDDPQVRITILQLGENGIPSVVFDRIFLGYVEHMNVTDKRMYVYDDGCGLRIFDVENPGSPSPLVNFRPSGHFQAMNIEDETLLSVSGREFYYHGSCEKWISNAPLFVDQEPFTKGIALDDISSLTEPKAILRKALPPEITGADASGNLVFAIANGDIYVVDAQDETNPRVVSFIETPGLAHASSLKDSFLIVADGEEGLSYYDISDPSSPEFMGSCPVDDEALDLLVEDNIAYVADKTAGLKIMNIDPGNCQLLASMEYDFARDLASAGDKGILLAGGNFMELINVKDPTNPYILSSMTAQNSTNEVSNCGYDGQYAFAAHYHGGTIYEISNPRDPVKISTFWPCGSFNDMLVTDERIYFANINFSQIVILDKSDITAPALIDRYITTGIPQGFAKNDKNIFLADKYSLKIFKEDINTAVDDPHADTLPRKFHLFQNYPNPFNSGTTIKYSLQRAGNVKITVYNILGDKVRTLVNKREQTGEHVIRWDGKNSTGQPVATGIYVYRMDSTNYSESKKMILLR